MDPSTRPVAALTTTTKDKDPLRYMTEQQYREQAAAATKELRRLRKELATLREELEMAVANHTAAAREYARPTPTT